MEEVYRATGIHKSVIQALENEDENRAVGYEKIAVLAKYYGVSCDYLLGLTDIPKLDYNLQKVHEYIGLSPSAIEYLHHIKNCNDISADSDILSLILEDKRFPLILGAIGETISIQMGISYDEQSPHYFSDDEITIATATVAMTRLIETVVQKYSYKYRLSPKERKAEYWSTYKGKNKAEIIPSTLEIIEKIKAFEKKQSNGGADNGID